jgi:ABC-type polysaccharide/polyol phosphate export permease
MVSPVRAETAVGALGESPPYPEPPPRYEITPSPWSGPAAAGQYWGLLHNLVSRAIKTRYKRSVLGFAWTMLNPLVTMITLTLVFSGLFAGTVPNYALFVIIGLLAWNLFALGSSQGLASIVDSGTLIRKVGVPKEIFPLAAVGANLVNFVLSLVPLLAVILLLRVPITWALLWLPVAALLMTVFTLGLAFLLATFNVFFRDVRYFYESALLAWFYVTPVIYPPEILPPAAHAMLRWNPMYALVELFRAPLYSGVAPTWDALAIATGESALMLAVGWSVFRRYQGRFVYYV